MTQSEQDLRDEIRDLENEVQLLKCEVRTLVNYIEELQGLKADLRYDIRQLQD